MGVSLRGCGRVLILGTLGGCSLFGPELEKVEREVESFLPEQQAAFRLLRIRCSRCHSPVQAFASHVPAGSWSAVVRRMARKPAAAIPPGDAARIAEFLEYYFDPMRQQPPVSPRSGGAADVPGDRNAKSE